MTGDDSVPLFFTFDLFALGGACMSRQINESLSMHCRTKNGFLRVKATNMYLTMRTRNRY